MTDVIEGRNPVIEALKAGRPMNKILLASNIERHTAVAEILALTCSRGIPVEYVPRQLLDRISGTGAHQGVVAYAAAKEYVSLEDLFRISRERKEPPLYIILDGLEDPQNFGSILRTADAAGVHGVIIRSRRAVGITPAVVKASAGAVEYVPVARVTNIVQAIETVKKNNIWVVGLDRGGPLNYSQVDFKQPSAVVIGGEGQGLSLLVKKKCDYLASIPMRGKISSLNAAVAAAVVLYEVVKQRQAQ